MRRASSSIVLANAVTASSSPVSPQAGDIRDRLALDAQPNTAARDRGDGIHDHLSAFASVFGIPDAKRVGRLVDEDPQPRVRRRVRVDHDSPRLLIAPAASLARDRLKRHAEPERLGKRSHRSQQMRVRVSPQRLAWRAERRLLSPFDRIDLRPVEHEHRPEQQPSPVGVLVAELVALLDRNGGDDRDRSLTLLYAIPQPQPRFEPATNVASGRASATSSWFESDSRARPV